MTNEQAIQILTEQIHSLRFVTEVTYKTWQTQTKSEIKKIFSAISDEYYFLNNFSFVSPFLDSPANMQIGKNRPTLIDFLERCIQTIERDKPIKQPDPIIKYVDRPVVKEVIKEVVKEVMVYPTKVNLFRSSLRWLVRKDILALIGAAAVILALPFWTGWFFAENRGEIKNFDLKMEVKQLKQDTTSLGLKNRNLLDSIFSIKSALDIANAKADSNTK